MRGWPKVRRMAAKEVQAASAQQVQIATVRRDRSPPQIKDGSPATSLSKIGQPEGIPPILGHPRIANR